MKAAETRRLALPGFVNAHSHGFQRRLRGRAEGGDFWAWREVMLAEAERQTPETVRAEYVETYAEMQAAGYTAVGEFHYLGLDEAFAAAEAAARGRRRADPAPLRVRARRYRPLPPGIPGRVPRAGRVAPWARDPGRRRPPLRPSVPVRLVGGDRPLRAAEGLPLHVHADEQPREIEECVAEHGVRPIELLARTGCLGPRTTVVHATHASDAELDLLAEAGARVCVCPTTEANLGDGFAPVAALRDRGIGICIGSDSNVRIDPLEELRELEGTARRAAGKRNVVSARLAARTIGSDEGAAALGLEEWPEATVDLDHRSLRGVVERDVLNALVFGCGADVFVEN